MEFFSSFRSLLFVVGRPLNYKIKHVKSINHNKTIMGYKQTIKNKRKREARVMTRSQGKLVDDGIKTMANTSRQRKNSIRWPFVLPEILLLSFFTLWNAFGDGNCLYWCLLEFEGVACTVANCQILSILLHILKIPLSLLFSNYTCKQLWIP